MPLTDTRWQKLSASWPLDGHEVWLRTENSFLGPLKCLFSQQDLKFLPSSLALDTPVSLGIPWYVVAEWRNTGALNPPDPSVWLASSPSSGVLQFTLTAAFPSPATGWQVRYRLVGSADPAVESAVTSAFTITIEGLTPGTVYEVQARYDMGAGPASSYTLPGQITISGAVLPSRAMRILAAQSVPATNDADPRTLFTVTLPAFTLGADGDLLDGLFIFDGGGSPPHFVYALGGVSLYETDESFGGGRWVNMQIWRVDSGHVGVMYFDINNGAADYVEVAVDLTVDQDFTLITSGVADSGITLEFARIRFEPAP